MMQVSEYSKGQLRVGNFSTLIPIQSVIDRQQNTGLYSCCSTGLEIVYMDLKHIHIR